MKINILKLILITLLCFISQIINAQNQLPIIKSNSKSVTILDGDHLRKGYWYIMPDKKPDIYLVENPKSPHKVAFYTDLDTITFDVTFHQTIDFIMLLNGKDSCLTRVSTIPTKPLICKKANNIDIATSDTIPFNLGFDNKTYIKARINQSKQINVLFDLGTTSSIINESASNKCKIVWSGTAQMGSVRGSNSVKTSEFNNIQIGNLIWDSIPIFSTKHTRLGSKGIIGNQILQEKIIEINYDLKCIIIHPTLPIKTNEYTQLEMQIRDGVPYIPVVLDNGSTKSKKWVMFDNGFDKNLLVDNEFAKSNNYYETLVFKGHRRNSMNGKTNIVLLPKLILGNYEINNIHIELQNPNDKEPYDRDLIGNAILKQFNVIVDYQNNYIYLKLNKLLLNN